MVIRFGILGAAKIAATMVPAINATTGASVVAIASRSQEKADAFACEHNLEYAFAAYEDMLLSDQIDAVYIALPIHVHKEWTITALRAGKAVLCEKSLSMNVADAIEMYTTAQQTGNLLQEVMAYRFHPMTQNIVSLIEQGIIGDVKFVHSDLHTPTCDPGDIRMQKKCGGGALRDLGVYCIDLSRLVFAAEPIGIQSHQVFSEIDETGEDGVDVGDVVIMAFKRGTAYFSCSLQTIFDCHYEITGSAGRIRCSAGAMVAWAGSEFTIDLYTDAGHQEIRVPAANPYQLMIDHFVDAYNNKTLEDPFENNSVGNLRVIESIVNHAQNDV